jgi:DnaJ-domain-containing protein 1
LDSAEGGKHSEYSAYINHARNTLLDDLKRAVYLVPIS